MAKANRNYVDGEKGAAAQAAPGEESADAGSEDRGGIHDSNVMTGADEDERLDASHQSVSTREGESREIQTRENTQDEERIAAFKQSVFSSALPDLPKIPGFHICWLTTTNPRDSIAARLRLGYQLIKLEEVPGFEHSVLASGPFEGHIGVNEMVAAKLPEHLYKAYMQEAHHNAPQEEEKRLRAVTEMIAEQAKGDSGKAPMIGDGTAALGKGPPRGKFEDL